MLPGAAIRAERQQAARRFPFGLASTPAASFAGVPSRVAYSPAENLRQPACKRALLTGEAAPAAIRAAPAVASQLEPASAGSASRS